MYQIAAQVLAIFFLSFLGNSDSVHVFQKSNMIHNKVAVSIYWHIQKQMLKNFHHVRPFQFSCKKYGQECPRAPWTYVEHTWWSRKGKFRNYIQNELPCAMENDRKLLVKYFPGTVSTNLSLLRLFIVCELLEKGCKKCLNMLQEMSKYSPCWTVQLWKKVFF